MKQRSKNGQTTLRTVANYVGLTPGTVSAVINNAPSSCSVPQHTKDRILAAARKLDYRPNMLARSLRQKRTYTIGVIACELGDAYAATVTAGIERYLREREYFFITGTHHNDAPLLDRYSSGFIQRGIEGLILMDLDLPQSFALPTVVVGVGAFRHRRLSAVCEAVESMGQMAARTLLAKIEEGDVSSSDISLGPELQTWQQLIKPAALS